MASVEQVAAACNIDVRRVQQLAKEGVMPREARGEYNIGKCMAAYIRYLQRAVSAKGTMGEDGDITSSHHERNNLLRLQTERERFELAKAKSEVISIDDHYEILSSLIIETKARVMAVGPRVAPTLVGETSRVMIQAKIEAESKVALQQLAASTPRLALPIAAPAPDPTPAPPAQSEGSIMLPTPEQPAPAAAAKKKRPAMMKAAKKRARKRKAKAPSKSVPKVAPEAPTAES